MGMSKHASLSRRSFLGGITGAAIGLPYLASFHGEAAAQSARPLRLIMVFHPQGTIARRFAPSATGALPSTLPDLLTPLNKHRSRLTVLSGVSNVVSAMNTASNGHNTAGRSIFTCQPFVGVKQGQSPDNGPADGPSFDWAVGPRMRGDAPRAVVNLGIADIGLGEYTAFWQGSGQAAGILGNPRSAADTLFSSIASGSNTQTQAAAPSRAELLRGRRARTVETVLGGYQRLSARAPKEDRVRLEAHMEQLRALDRVTGSGGTQMLASCSKPGLSSVSGNYDAGSSEFDDKSATAQIENAAMLLACDVTRVVTLQFAEYHDPRFPFLFNGDNGAVVRGSHTYGDWHAMIHEARAGGDTQGESNLASGMRWYMAQVAALADRLASIEDGPGQTLLDNTLILAMSEFGDGSVHDTSNLPVTLIGNLGGKIRSAGQHVRAADYSTGDLFTTLQTALTGDTTPFGITGRRDDGTPFHRGAIPGLI
ncbi:MAG: hypothetical protein RL385_2501 [Pseudomonadota bacterium]